MALRAIKDLPKFVNLQEDLQLGYFEALGLLEAIWHMTAKVSPRGDIGRSTDKEIARWIGWQRTTPEVMISALIKNRWLDQHPRYRLCTHDWNVWADSSVKATLRNRSQVFVQDEPDYSKLTNIPEKIPGAPGINPGAPPESGSGPGSESGAGAEPPTASPVLEEEFSGKTKDQRSGEPHDPLANFPEAIKPRARELFVRYWFWHRGCLPNLERTDVKEGMIKVAGVIKAFPNRAETEINRFLDDPPAGYPQGSTHLWQIFAYCGLDAGKPDKSRPKLVLSDDKLLEVAKRRLLQARKDGQSDDDFLAYGLDLPREIKMQAIAAIPRQSA